MPLQFLPLDLSRYDRPRVGAGTPQPRTPVSEALTPRARGAVGGMPAGEGFMERERRLQEEEDKRKHELKLMDKRMEMIKLEAGLKEDAAKKITPMTAGQAPAPAAPELTKENMPEAAMEVWKFISTLEPESQKFFIQQLKQKEQPTGYIEAAGKRVEVPGSVGMYGHLVDQGLIDPATDTVIEKEREFEKGTFQLIEKGGNVYKFNTATNEEILLGSVDEPESVIAEINKDANTQALAISKTSVGTADVITFTEAKFDVLKDSYNMSDEEATELSKIQKIPKDPSKLPWYTKAINWVKSKTEGEMPSGWAPKGAGVPGAVAFNEAKVTSLVPVISDDVTTTERAHFKGQGASDSDIDEAIRRKAGE